MKKIITLRDCFNCERRDKRTGGARCKVFFERPDNCWAWTDDPDWEKKVEEATRQYALEYAKKHIGGAVNENRA